MHLIDKQETNEEALLFCSDFIDCPTNNRYIFGINEYATEIANAVEVGGFIDDFYPNNHFLGKPVVKTDNIPKNTLVVSSLLGRPLTAKKVLTTVGVRNIDYFSFHKYSGLIKHPVRFWGDGKEDIDKHTDEYLTLYNSLADTESKKIFRAIINFRMSARLDYLDGFTDRQQQQYFEPFMHLQKDNETFVDVGGYHGETTSEFIHQCPEFNQVYLFEPDPTNMQHAKDALHGKDNITFLEFGASNRSDSAFFSSTGSTSQIEATGNQEIKLEKIDSIIDKPVTFIKMDIEGAEKEAIDGARKTIIENHPLLAISVYHHSSDIRTIPAQILSIRGDYNIYIRHYTEGVVETIMYFVPTTIKNQ